MNPSFKSPTSQTTPISVNPENPKFSFSSSPFSPMDVSPMSPKMSPPVPEHSPMSTSPPLCTDLVISAFQEPLEIAYPGETNNPINLEETPDVSVLPKRTNQATFPTRRSVRNFEKAFGSGESSTKRKKSATPPSSSSSSADSEKTFSGESQPESPASPSFTNLPESSEEDEIPDDTPLNKFYFKKSGHTSRETKSSSTPQDVTENVMTSSESSSDSSVRGLTSSSSESASEVTPFSSEFLTANHSKHWSWFNGRAIRTEKVLDIVSCSSHGLVDFFTSRNLLDSVNNKCPYVDKVVKLFYANLTSKIEKPKSKHFGKVFLYNKFYDFTPTTINQCLNRVNDDERAEREVINDRDEVISYLTGGVVKKWISRCPTSILTALFAVLHKLMIHNWLCSLNKSIVTIEQALFLYKIGKGLSVDIGKTIFQQIVNMAEKDTGIILPFPSLIFKVLTSQGFQAPKQDLLWKEPEVYVVNQTILKSKSRIIDLPWTNTAGSASVTRNVPDISSNISQSSFTTAWLVQEIAKLNAQIAGVDQVRKALVEARERYLFLLSSQKGGDGSGPGGATDRAECSNQRGS